MSGPKLSAAEIEALRRRKIAMLRKENEEIISNAVKAIRSEAEKARSVANRLGRYQREALNSLGQAEERHIEAIMLSGTDGYPHDPSQAVSFNGQTRAKAQEAIEAFKQELIDLEQEWDRDLVGTVHLRQINKVAASIEVTLDDGPQICSSADLIAEVLDEQTLSINRLKQLEAEGYVSILNDAANRITDIQTLVLSSGVPANKKAILTKAASSIQDALLQFQSDRSKELELSNALKSAYPEIISARKNDKECKSLYDKCRLCVAQISELTGYEMQIPRIDQIATTQDLTNLLYALEEKAQCATENAYIAYAIDEVMARHGYVVKKSVQLFSAPEQDRKLYLDKHSDVGIHAYQGANGMVMMETASISSSVRDGGDDLTVERTVPESSYERARLVKEQASFCSLFSEVVSDLGEYGITLAVKSDKTPSEDTSVAFDTVDAAVQGLSTDMSAAMRRRRRRVQREGSRREVN